MEGGGERGREIEGCGREFKREEEVEGNSGEFGFLRVTNACMNTHTHTQVVSPSCSTE